MLKNVLLGLVLPIALIAIGVGVFLGIGRPTPPKNPPLGESRAELLSVLPIAEVETVRALAELSETLDVPVTGTVVPFRELQIAAEVAGRIIEKDPQARSGNYVTKGQILYRIDPRDYEIDVDRLTRRRDQELASIRELEQDIANSEALLQLADQEYALAEAEVKRFDQLRSGISSPAEYDAARRSRLTSMNQKVTLQNQIKTFEARKDRLQLATKLAETELEQAQLNLERTVVRAPVDGRIVNEQVEADSFVQRGAQLVLIEDTEKVEVACNVRMDQLYWILDQKALSAEQLLNAAQASRFQLPHTPAKVRFKIAGRDDLVCEWNAKLDRYDGAGLDAQSRTVPIRVLVDEPSRYTILGQSETQAQGGGPPMLVRGMFVDVIVKAKPATPLLLVPKLSIKPATNSYEIWKYEPDEQAMYRSAEAIRAADFRKKAKDDASAEATAESPSKTPPKLPTADNAADASASGRAVDLDPDMWDAGFLQTLKEVQIVGAFVPPPSIQGTLADVEYTICEITDGMLTAGDQVIVTPLPGTQGQNDLPIRVKRSKDEK